MAVEAAGEFPFPVVGDLTWHHHICTSMHSRSLFTTIMPCHVKYSHSRRHVRPYWLQSWIAYARRVSIRYRPESSRLWVLSGRLIQRKADICFQPSTRARKYSNGNNCDVGHINSMLWRLQGDVLLKDGFFKKGSCFLASSNRDSASLVSMHIWSKKKETKKKKVWIFSYFGSLKYVRYRKVGDTSE